MRYVKADTDLFEPIFLGDFGPHSEGVTGLAASTNLTVYEWNANSSPNKRDISSHCTLNEVDSTNTPGWYVLQVDNTGSPGVGWSSGEEYFLVFKCADSPVTFMDPPVIRVRCVDYEEGDIAGAVWDALQVNHTASGSFGEDLNAILVNTNELQTDDYPSRFDSVDAAIAARPSSGDIADAVLEEGVAAHTGASPDNLADYIDRINTLCVDTYTYLIVTVDARFDSIDNNLNDIDANLADVEEEVGRPQIQADFSSTPFHYPGVESKFAVALRDSNTGALIPAADISSGNLIIQKHVEDPGSWLAIYDSTPTIEDGRIYVDYDVGAGDGAGGGGRVAVAGDLIRWSVKNLVVTTGDSPERTYQVTPSATFGAFIVGKCLSEPTPGSGGGATVEEIFDTSITAYQKERTAGGILNMLDTIVPRIQRWVRNTLEFFGIRRSP